MVGLYAGKSASGEVGGKMVISIYIVINAIKCVTAKINEM